MKTGAHRILLLCITFFLIFLFTSPLSSQNAKEDERVTDLREAVQKLRRLNFKHEVPVVYFSKAQIRDFLIKAFAPKEQKSRLADEELALKCFGFVPEDFNLEEFYIRLYSEQILGLYDYEEKRFILSKECAPENEEAEQLKKMGLDVESSVIIHELDHALQDQHFDLRKLIKSLEGGSFDESLAGQSLFEGDASYVMFDFMLKCMGMSIEMLPPNMFELMNRLTESAGVTKQDAMAGAPLYFKETSLFPYMQGLSFIRSIKEDDGWDKVNKVYSAPPGSTEQVLHPEKYKQNEQGAIITIPENLLPGWKTSLSNTLGEFLISVLYRQFLGKNENNRSSGWNGDRFIIFAKNGKNALLWCTCWDSLDDSKRNYDTLKALFEKKYSLTAWKSFKDKNEVTAGIKEGAGILISLMGKNVTVIEGVPEQDLGRIASQLKKIQIQK